MDSKWKAALRTRMLRATIGIVMVGGVAGIAAAHTIQGNTGAPIASSSSSAAATSTVAPAATRAATIIVASGTIASVDSSTNSLVLVQDSGNQQVIDLSATTQFMGDVSGIGQLRAGMQAQVTGQMLADGSLSALTLVSRFRGD